MENLNDLYKHSMTHPDVAEAYIKGLDVPEAILQNEVPDTSVAASFDPTPDPEPATYTVTVAVADGQDEMGEVTVEKVGGTEEPGTSVTVNAGDSVQIKATTTEGYEFDKWMIDAVATEYEATDTIENVSEDIDLVASFKQSGKGGTKSNPEPESEEPKNTEDPVEDPENDLPGTLDDPKGDDDPEGGEEEPKKE